MLWLRVSMSLQKAVLSMFFVNAPWDRRENEKKLREMRAWKYYCHFRYFFELEQSALLNFLKDDLHFAFSLSLSKRPGPVNVADLDGEMLRDSRRFLLSGWCCAIEMSLKQRAPRLFSKLWAEEASINENNIFSCSFNALSFHVIWSYKERKWRRSEQKGLSTFACFRQKVGNDAALTHKLNVLTAFWLRFVLFWAAHTLAAFQNTPRGENALSGNWRFSDWTVCRCGSSWVTTAMGSTCWQLYNLRSWTIDDDNT